jgi:hypothetical protein
MRLTRLSKPAGVTALAVGIAAVTLVGGAPSAGAADELHIIKTLSSDFVGPLQFAVDGKRVIVADSFTSQLFRVGRATPIATGPDPSTGGDLAGVAINPTSHTIAYTTNTGDHSVTQLVIRPQTSHPVVADLSGYEATANPDQVNHYGPVGRINACARKAIRKLGAPTPLRYTGIVDSHAYSVASIGGGNWAVGDAGGNDILKVDPAGHVSTIAVLPPIPVEITSDIASGLKLPDCTIGVVYRFEPVPTDVEQGPDGDLYVTALTGASDLVGAGGVLYHITSSGAPEQIAAGFVGATNLAISPSGTIYVANLFSGDISKVEGGTVTTVANLPGVAGLEWDRGHLFASTAPAVIGSSDPGSIYKLG